MNQFHSVFLNSWMRSAKATTLTTTRSSTVYDYCTVYIIITLEWTQTLLPEGLVD